MKTIAEEYRYAFRVPMLLGGSIIAALGTFFLITFQSSFYRTFFSRVIDGCVQTLGIFFDSGHLPHFLAFGGFILLVSIFTISFFRQWFVTHRFLRSLNRYVPSARVNQPGNIIFIEGDTAQCFCAGFIHPKIYLSRRALETLEARELTAVLTHEQRHAVARDPLRSAMLRALAHTFFFLPIVRSYERRYHEVKEIMADAVALGIPGGKQSLAGALLKFSREAAPAHASLSFFADRTLIDLRIEFMSGHVYIPLPLTWSKIIVSCCTIFLLFALLIPSTRAETVVLSPCLSSHVIHDSAHDQPLRYRFLETK